MKWVVKVMRRMALEGNTSDQGFHLICLGDSNLHNPMWDKSHNSHLFMRNNLDKAWYLIDTTAELNLHMALPRGLPSLQVMLSGNYMQPDNVFVSSSLDDAITKCNTVPEEQPPRCNHILIITVIKMSPKASTEGPRENYRISDWDAVREELVLWLDKLEVDKDMHMEVEFYSQL